jgi:hypothetical protein
MDMSASWRIIRLTKDALQAFEGIMKKNPGHTYETLLQALRYTKAIQTHVFILLTQRYRDVLEDEYDQIPQPITLLVFILVAEGTESRRTILGYGHEIRSLSSSAKDRYLGYLRFSVLQFMYIRRIDNRRCFKCRSPMYGMRARRPFRLPLLRSSQVILSVLSPCAHPIVTWL